MDGESIDVAEFLRARAREIEAMEKSLSVSHKTSLHWQKCPHYLRRRSRCPDPRRARGFARRRKDRHFLRTHTYYAKRFFMLALSGHSVPLRRRLKAAKLLYRCPGRGYLLDESYRGVFSYRLEDVLAYAQGAPGREGPGPDAPGAPPGGAEGRRPRYQDARVSRGAVGQDVLARVNFSRHRIVQVVGHRYEFVIDGDRFTSVGCELPLDEADGPRCTVAVYGTPADFAAALGETPAALYPVTRGFPHTYRIVCERRAVMDVYQRLTGRAGMLPACLEDVQRFAVENNTLTAYDLVGTELYREIEDAANREAAAEYGRRPPERRQAAGDGRASAGRTPPGAAARQTL